MGVQSMGTGGRENVSETLGGEGREDSRQHSSVSDTASSFKSVQPVPVQPVPVHPVCNLPHSPSEEKDGGALLSGVRIVTEKSIIC